MASALNLIRISPHKNLKLYFKGCNSFLRPSSFQHSKIIFIHTSKKSTKGTFTSVEPVPLVDAIADPKRANEVPIPYRTPENWVSYGFCSQNIYDDSTYAHLVFFLMVTMIFCGTTFILMYMPDFRMIEWVKREAYLELRRREEAGEPLVNKDLVPVESFELPSDEELGDVVITI